MTCNRGSFALAKGGEQGPSNYLRRPQQNSTSTDRRSGKENKTLSIPSSVRTKYDPSSNQALWSCKPAPQMSIWVSMIPCFLIGEILFVSHKTGTFNNVCPSWFIPRKSSVTVKFEHSGKEKETHHVQDLGRHDRKTLRINRKWTTG